jgi:hypothetical protein
MGLHELMAATELAHPSCFAPFAKTILHAQNDKQVFGLP